MKAFFSYSLYNSSRVYLAEFARRAGASAAEQDLVLDAGAGHAPYKKHFSHAIYESADFGQVKDKNYAPITYVCDLASIPVDDERYDLVFCSQVLEHLPDPQTALHEFYRILKPGKALWLSAPLFFAEHEQPYDFYRYTQFGFTHLLQEAGFEVESIEWLEGYFGTLSYQMITIAREMPSKPADYGGGLIGVCGALLSLGLRPLAFGLARLFSYYDGRHKYVSSGLCKNYAIIARKPV